jgi:hypothetical protein
MQRADLNQNYNKVMFFERIERDKGLKYNFEGVKSEKLKVWKTEL